MARTYFHILQITTKTANLAKGNICVPDLDLLKLNILIEYTNIEDMQQEMCDLFVLKKKAKRKCVKSLMFGIIERFERKLKYSLHYSDHNPCSDLRVQQNKICLTLTKLSTHRSLHNKAVPSSESESLMGTPYIFLFTWTRFLLTRLYMSENSWEEKIIDIYEQSKHKKNYSEVIFF